MIGRNNIIEYNLLVKMSILDYFLYVEGVNANIVKMKHANT